MKISLEHLTDSPNSNSFRVAFHSATQRWLLPYPCVTGFVFADESGRKVSDWRTRYPVSEPLDDFVLRPSDKISFELCASINCDSRNHRWVLELESGTYNVHFSYLVDREADWYDYLAKRSRFAGITEIWRGEVQSNQVLFTL